jgi:hypothetical protein
VQRHGNDEVRLSQQVSAGRRHPAGEKVEAVASPLVFQRQDQIARDFAIFERGAGTVVSRRMGEACAAFLRLVDRDLERRAAEPADRVRDEAELRPEFGLQRARACR